MDIKEFFPRYTLQNSIIKESTHSSRVINRVLRVEYPKKNFLLLSKACGELVFFQGQGYITGNLS